MRLQLDARARRWLRRLPVVNVYSLGEIVLLALLAVQVARLVWTLAAPVDPLGPWRPAAAAVPGSPLDTLTGFDPFFRLTPAANGPATVTTLQVKLFGTRMDDATGGGSAIIAGPDGVQDAFSVGEEVAPGVKLKAVFFDHVTLDRGGAEEDLFLDQSGAPAAPPASGAAPPPAPPAGPAVGQLRQEIGFIPRLDGGRVSGLVVRPQGSGALFRQAGLREGDVLTSIGGRPVAGPDDLERIGRDFRAGGNIPILVERGGQTVPLAITVAPTP
jgi:general secretion pathway protein C